MNILKEHKENIQYFQFKRFQEIDFIDHIFSSKIGWAVENTFNNVSNILDIEEVNIIHLRQIHSNHIEIIDKNIENYSSIIGKEGDGLITNISNLALMTYHADCVPIYFIDTNKKKIGLAHGGWRGSFDNISGKMVETFIKNFNTDPQDLLVGIGPSIGPCCYEVSRNLGEDFLKKYRSFNEIIIKKQNKVYLDLWRLNYLQLKSAGVLENNIINSKACTSCNVDEFYSYRRENGTQERMVAVIKLI